jgi:hypothetical protein
MANVRVPAIPVPHAAYIALSGLVSSVPSLTPCFRFLARQRIGWLQSGFRCACDCVLFGYAYNLKIFICQEKYKEKCFMIKAIKNR